MKTIVTGALEPEGALATSASLTPDVAEGESRPKAVLFFLLLYLVIDYGRPQDLVPGLGAVRPAAVATIFLAVAYLAVPRMWVRSPQFAAIWMFVGILAVWVPFARNNFFAYNITRTMLYMVPCVLALPLCIRSTSDAKRMFAFLILLMAWQAGWAVTHGGRGTGATIADENDLSLYVNTYVPFAFFLFRTEKRTLMKLFYAAATLLGVAAVVASRSRGGFVGLVAMAVVAWLFSAHKIRALVLIAVVAWCLTLFANASYWERISTATDSQEGTGRERVESWKAGWRMFVANPIGVGGGNYPTRFPEYQGSYFKKGMWGRQAHSIWVTVLAELGVPGVLVFGSLVFYNLRGSFRIRRAGKKIGGERGAFFAAVGSGMLASFAGFFASGTFLSVLYYPHFWYLSGLVVAMASVATAGEREGGLSTS